MTIEVQTMPEAKLACSCCGTTKEKNEVILTKPGQYWTAGGRSLFDCTLFPGDVDLVLCYLCEDRQYYERCSNCFALLSSDASLACLVEAKDENEDDLYLCPKCNPNPPNIYRGSFDDYLKGVIIPQPHKKLILSPSAGGR